MDTLETLNTVLAKETDIMKDKINEYCAKTPRCANPDAPHVIKSEPLCIVDVRYSEMFKERLTQIFNDLQEKVFQSGYFAGECRWVNIMDAECNPHGNMGQFVVTLA